MSHIKRTYDNRDDGVHATDRSLRPRLWAPAHHPNFLLNEKSRLTPRQMNCAPLVRQNKPSGLKKKIRKKGAMSNTSSLCEEAMITGRKFFRQHWKIVQVKIKNVNICCLSRSHTRENYEQL